MKPVKKRGRPPEPVPKGMASQIIQAIADGQNLREFCRQKGKPKWRTVYEWREKDQDFATRFAKARETGADAIAEDAISILDEEPRLNAQGGVDSGYVSWAKNRAEYRFKLLSKWFPTKYGERTTLAGDKDNPLVTKQLTDSDRIARLTTILQRASSRTAEAEQEPEGDDAG